MWVLVRELVLVLVLVLVLLLVVVVVVLLLLLFLLLSGVRIETRECTGGRRLLQHQD